MRLQDYPVPANNNKFGYHLFPFPQDLDGRDKAAHLWPLEQTIAQGGQWVCMLSSPGGDTNWPGNTPGSCEWSFELSNDLGLWNIVRIYTSSNPPYWHDAVHKNLEQLVDIASGRPFYIKFNNEIDAEWGASNDGHAMTLEDARRCCVAIGEAIDRTWDYFGGLVIPSFLSVGYGGQGYNFFELMHEVGMGDRLDRCWIPVHPYAGGWESLWPWSKTLLEPVLYTPETYAQFSRWQWKLDAPDKRTLEMVNENLMIAHQERMTLHTTEDLLGAYAYGFYTYLWALYQLDQLGHTETPLLFPEWGTRVGEDVVVGPKVDIDLHYQRTVEQIRLMRLARRVLGGANWTLDTRGGVQPNWKDQGINCEIWDPSIVDMEPDLEVQIITPGRLRLADELLANPVGGTMNKLCPHVQYLDNETLEAIGRIKPPMVKIMNADVGQLEAVRAASPESLIVARIFQDTQDYSNPVVAGIAFADRFAPIVDHIDVAEVFNEAINNLATYEQMYDFDIYQETFAEQIWSMNPDVKIGLFCLPTGNFGWSGEPSLTPTNFSLSFGLPIDRVYICLHEYTWFDWTFEIGARMLRYRTQMEWAAAQGYKCLITECGFTNAIVEFQPDVGWRSDPVMWPREKVIEHLRQYEAELQEDDYVVGAAIFTVGRNEGWPTFESLTEWEAAVGTPIEQPPEPPEEPEEPPMPEPEPINDAKTYGVTLDTADVPEGALYWKCKRIHHLTADENSGNHNIYVNVFRMDGSDPARVFKEDNAPLVTDQRPDVQMFWPDGTAKIPLEKSWPDEPMGNGVLTRDGVGVMVLSEIDSDRVLNLHTNHPDELKEDGTIGNSNGHHSFLVEWQLCQKGGESEPEPPTPEPGETLKEFIRRRSWDAVGVDYNPDAAFTKYAEAHDLGKPETNEFDIVYLDARIYRVQAYAGGLVYCVVGEWNEIAHVGWAN